MSSSVWIPFASHKPKNNSRVIIHREIGQQSYVDVLTYIEEPESGLPPMCNTKHITHWMPMPEPPITGVQVT